ncbi:hypothetical protein JRQ81_001422 [Phrynocephalus forsythii]|uniref:Uncharacterized protein n=1 Tax=Phrynocephalus forsythii TaxID=171643 RepID=A0A9Q0Y7T2_9SAUR|nr:hypothetical protein JRQ81_001422 [Phrynocephalus forsythii]
MGHGKEHDPVKLDIPDYRIWKVEATKYGGSWVNSERLKVCTGLYSEASSGESQPLYYLLWWSTHFNLQEKTKMLGTTEDVFLLHYESDSRSVFSLGNVY